MKKTLVIALVMTFALFGCDNGGGGSTPQATVPQPKVITQASGGLAFDGKVTISTNDQYTPAQWNAVVASVVTAFNAAYEGATGPAQGRFKTVFANNANAQIVLVNNLTNNWEVRDGEFSTMYLKTSSIATATYSTAVANMGAQNPEVGNAAPPQRGVFLAGGVNHGGQRGNAA